MIIMMRCRQCDYWRNLGDGYGICQCSLNDNEVGGRRHYTETCQHFTCLQENAKTEIKDSGERTQFSTGAVRDMSKGKGRFDLLPWEAIWEVAKHCEEGAKKYGERNCEKGIPIHSLLDSSMRHLAKYMMGFKNEPHLRAAAWNILYALYMEEKHPEMQDIPTRLNTAE